MGVLDNPCWVFKCATPRDDVKLYKVVYNKDYFTVDFCIKHRSIYNYHLTGQGGAYSLNYMRPKLASEYHAKENAS